MKSIVENSNVKVLSSYENLNSFADSISESIICFPPDNVLIFTD